MNNVPFAFSDKLDREFLFNIYENDNEHASMIFEQFLQTAPRLMDEIDACFATGNVESFRQKVHKLKPSFSFVGLTKLTTEAESLEKGCLETSDINDVALAYVVLKNHYEESYPIIQNELQRLKEQINITL